MEDLHIRTETCFVHHYLQSGFPTVSVKSRSLLHPCVVALSFGHLLPSVGGIEQLLLTQSGGNLDINTLLC